MRRALDQAGPSTADLTPVLDAIFLIILLLLATLMHSSVVRGFGVNVPACSSQGPIQKHDERIEISVDGAGQTYVDKECLGAEAFWARLGELAAASDVTTVLLRAEESVAYGRVAEVLAQISKRLPNTSVVLVTQRHKSAAKATVARSR